MVKEPALVGFKKALLKEIWFPCMVLGKLTGTGKMK